MEVILQFVPWHDHSHHGQRRSTDPISAITILYTDMDGSRAAGSTWAMKGTTGWPVRLIPRFCWHHNSNLKAVSWNKYLIKALSLSVTPVRVTPRLQWLHLAPKTVTTFCRLSTVAVSKRACAWYKRQNFNLMSPRARNLIDGSPCKHCIRGTVGRYKLESIPIVFYLSRYAVLPECCTCLKISVRLVDFGSFLQSDPVRTRED